MFFKIYFMQISMLLKLIKLCLHLKYKNENVHIYAKMMI